MKIYKLILIAASIILLSLGCEKEKPAEIEPEIVLSSDTMIFNEIETKILFISTEPSSEGEFQVISYPDWVDVYPESGFISNDIQEISITSNMDKSKPGLFTGELKIMSTFGTYSVVLQVFVGDNLIYSIPDSIEFTVFDQSKNLRIENQGNVNLSFNASVSNDFISLSQISGEIEVGQQKDITIDLNTDKLESGTYQSEIYLSINDEIDTVKVSIEIFEEQKISLLTDVIDAEYIKTKNLLVFVSATPSQLNIFNPAANSLKAISLTYIPTCLSISPNGETVAVGHDGHITLVDLDPLSIIKTTSVSCQAFDIVLASENWAYVFPEEDQWERIRCVDLDTEIETESSGNLIYENTRARLHPSGKYIYTAADDLEKFDISGGTADYLYDSPYHGDYPIYNNLWFSEDGLRIFTEGGSVFKTSEIQSNDLLYNGTISLNGQYFNRIVWLDHSGYSSNLFVIKAGNGYGEPNQPNVSIYNAINLVYKKEIELEKFLVPNGFGGGSFYNPEPFFVFSNSTLKEIYVLSKAKGSGLLYEWAIEKVSYE